MLYQLHCNPEGNLTDHIPILIVFFYSCISYNTTLIKFLYSCISYNAIVIMFLYSCISYNATLIMFLTLVSVTQHLWLCFCTGGSVAIQL